MALSVTNACRLPVELPDLFFRWLVLGGEGPPGNGHNQARPSSSSSTTSFQPSVADMVALDPSLAQPFEALTEAVQMEDALNGLLDIEGLPADTPAAEYISHMVRQTFLDPVQWQIAEVREGFFRVLPAPTAAAAAGVERSPKGGCGSAALAVLLPRPAVLAEIVRGSSPLVGDSSYDGGGGGGQGGGPFAPTPGEADAAGGGIAAGKAARDFDFREAFAVYEDRDLVACPPLREVCRASSYAS